MRDAAAAKTAAIYGLAWTISAAVGTAIAGLGIIQWLLPAYARYGDGVPPGQVLQAAAPGLALVVLGVLIWKVTSAVVLYRTLSVTLAAGTAGRLNTEAMKSDILSVLDERLADMKQDTQRTRRVVERESSEEAADEFGLPSDR